LFCDHVPYGQAHVITDIYVSTRRCPYPFLATFHALLCRNYVGGSCAFPDMVHVISAPSGLIRIKETGIGLTSKRTDCLLSDCTLWHDKKGSVETLFGLLVSSLPFLLSPIYKSHSANLPSTTDFLDSVSKRNSWYSLYPAEMVNTDYITSTEALVTHRDGLAG